MDMICFGDMGSGSVSMFVKYKMTLKLPMGAPEGGSWNFWGLQPQGNSVLSSAIPGYSLHKVDRKGGGCQERLDGVTHRKPCHT